MISVLMPVYNGRGFLAPAIDSILNQTHKDLELVVVDDCSDDPRIQEILLSYLKQDSRVVVYRNPENRGPAYCRNMCLEIARGDVFAEQDSDDISLPDRLKHELSHLKGNVGLVSCWGRTMSSTGQLNAPDPYLSLQISDDQEIKRRLFEKDQNHIIGPATMFPRKVFESIGYYDELCCSSIGDFSDGNYWMRILKKFDLSIVHEELYHYRIHGKSISRRHGAKYLKQRNEMFALSKKRASECPVIKKRERPCH